MTVLGVLYRKYKYTAFDRKNILKLNKLIKNHPGIKCITIIDTSTFLQPEITLWNWHGAWKRVFCKLININEKIKYAEDIIVLASIYQDVLVELVELSLLSRVKIPEKLKIINLYVCPYSKDGLFLRQLEKLQINFVLKLTASKNPHLYNEELEDEITSLLERMSTTIKWL